MCAGIGSRMGKSLNSTPKSLLKYKSKTLLSYWIEKFDNEKNCKILINTHFKKEQFYNYFKKNNYNSEIILTYEENLLGSLGTLIQNNEFILDSKNFVVIYPDSYSEINLNKFIDFHNEKKANFTMALNYVEDFKNSGIVSLDKDSKISYFVEKPLKTISKLASCGLYIFDTEFFKSKISSFDKNKILDISKNFVTKNYLENFYGYKIREKFYSIGTEKEYKIFFNL